MVLNSEFHSLCHFYSCWVVPYSAASSIDYNRIPCGVRILLNMRKSGRIWPNSSILKPLGVYYTRSKLRPKSLIQCSYARPCNLAMDDQRLHRRRVPSTNHHISECLKVLKAHFYLKQTLSPARQTAERLLEGAKQPHLPSCKILSSNISF